MIAHQEDALEKVKDRQVRAWAEALLQAKEKEITLMLLASGPRGLDQGAHAAMLREVAGMLKRLKEAQDPDRAFVQGSWEWPSRPSPRPRTGGFWTWPGTSP